MMRCWLILLLLLGVFPVAVAAQAPKDLARQREEQEAVRAETDRFARRVGMVLRVLQQNQLDGDSETELLQELVDNLSRLSKDEMTAVIARLEVAQKTADAQRAKAEQDEAGKQHGKALASLKIMLAKYDAIRSLDQASEQLERLARKQFDLTLETTRLKHLAANSPLPVGVKDRQGYLSRLAQKLAFAQKEIQDEFMKMCKQLNKLAKSADAASPHPWKQVQAAIVTRKHEERSVQSIDALFEAKLTDALARQQPLAADMLYFAQVLRPVPERTAALREVRRQLERIISEQEPLLLLTEVADAKALAELVSRQAGIEFDTLSTRLNLHRFVEPLANKLTVAESAMNDSAVSLIRGQKDASKSQSQALAVLREVDRELEKLLAESQTKPTEAIDLAKLASDLAKAIALAHQAADQSKLAANSGQPPTQQNLDQSQAATQAALATLQQSLPQAPANLLPTLQKAAASLQQASQQLQKQQPMPANQAQMQAAKLLQQAAASLPMPAVPLALSPNAIAPPSAAMTAPAVAAFAPMASPSAKAGVGPATVPGLGSAGPGLVPGSQLQFGPGALNPANQNSQSLVGSAKGSPKPAMTPSQLLDVQGDGSYLTLPPQDRGRIQQALNQNLPPEFAFQIRQYYLNLARGKSALPTGTTKKR